jgi:hypothetical protein
VRFVIQPNATDDRYIGRLERTQQPGYLFDLSSRYRTEWVVSLQDLHLQFPLFRNFGNAVNFRLCNDGIAVANGLALALGHIAYESFPRNQLGEHDEGDYVFGKCCLALR